MNTFVSSKGVEISIKPVSQFKIDALRASKIEPEIPTYTVKTVTGEEQTFQLDGKSAVTRNMEAEWEAYVTARNKAEAENAKAFFELLVWDGVDVEVPGEGSSWDLANKHFGIKVPADPYALKAHYVYTELLGKTEDIGELMAAIFKASGVDEEAVERLRKSFRIGVSGTANRPVSNRTRKLESKVKDV